MKTQKPEIRLRVSVLKMALTIFFKLKIGFSVREFMCVYGGGYSTFYASKANKNGNNKFYSQYDIIE